MPLAAQMHLEKHTACAVVHRSSLRSALCGFGTPDGDSPSGRKIGLAIARTLALLLIVAQTRHCGNKRIINQNG